MIFLLLASHYLSEEFEFFVWFAAFVFMLFIHLFFDAYFENKDMEERGMWYWEYLEKHGFTNLPNL